MKRFICRRLITGILTIFIVFVLNFLLIQAAPGSPVTTLMGKENHDPEIRAMLEEKYGFDQPIIVQLGRQLEMLFHGDLAKAKEIYSWVVCACGNDLDKLLTRERIAQIVKEKAELQLFA